MERGKLIVVSGFSGVGKGTVIKKLMEKEEGFGFSVSATTRYCREGEVEGKDYFFISKEEFEEGITIGRFLEFTRYNGNYYGTPLDYIFEQMDRGITIILDIECEGAFNVRKRVPEAQLIYMIPPSGRELVDRLVNRKTETREQIRGRLEKAVKECDSIPDYDGIIMNKDVDDCVSVLSAMIREPERMRSAYEKNLTYVPGIRRELEEILESWDAQAAETE